MPLIFALDRHLDVPGGYRYDQPALDLLERKRQAMVGSRGSDGIVAGGGDSSAGAFSCGDSGGGAACGDSGGGGCGGGACGGGCGGD
jgi:hypothetical protein